MKINGLKKDRNKNIKIKMNNNDLTSIIIVNCNGGDYLKKCIQSLLTNTHCMYELIVVDNGSVDGSLEYIKNIENVKLISNPINKGAPYARNQGLSLAEGKYIVFLDNDVVLTNQWLSRFIKYTYLDPSVDIWGPMSNYVSGIQLVPNVPYRNYSELQTFSARWACSNIDKFIYTKRLILFCMFVKREVVEKIGGFDPVFENWGWEDDDYCIRAQIAGFKLGVACEIFVHHEGSRTPNIDRNILLVKNGKLFMRKWNINEWDMNSVVKYPVDKIISRRFDSHEHVVDIPDYTTFKSNIYDKKFDGFKFTSFWNMFCNDAINDKDFQLISDYRRFIDAIVHRDVKSLSVLLGKLNIEYECRAYASLIEAIICLLKNDLNSAINYLNRSLQYGETLLVLKLIFYLTLFLGDYNSARKVADYLSFKYQPRIDNRLIDSALLNSLSHP